MTQVVAALLERDGRILIGQRRSDRRHPLKWEFPGGKVEPGEDPAAAVKRELREELGIEVLQSELIDSYEVRYGDSPALMLLFYRVTAFAGEPRNLDFKQITWETRERLKDYDFLEGDIPFITRLAEPR
jgi:8-oxo-dGTP diphosphatase